MRRALLNLGGFPFHSFAHGDYLFAEGERGGFAVGPGESSREELDFGGDLAVAEGAQEVREEGIVAKPAELAFFNPGRTVGDGGG
jgi:hypothetical protein